jgi:hypothetical protein
MSHAPSQVYDKHGITIYQGDDRDMLPRLGTGSMKPLTFLSARPDWRPTS